MKSKVATKYLHHGYGVLASASLHKKENPSHLEIKIAHENTILLHICLSKLNTLSKSKYAIE